jgi:hypothetical protein
VAVDETVLVANRDGHRHLIVGGGHALLRERERGRERKRERQNRKNA